jgi:hypothetical protein
MRPEAEVFLNSEPAHADTLSAGSWERAPLAPAHADQLSSDPSWIWWSRAFWAAVLVLPDPAAAPAVAVELTTGVVGASPFSFVTFNALTPSPGEGKAKDKGGVASIRWATLERLLSEAAADVIGIQEAKLTDPAYRVGDQYVTLGSAACQGTGGHGVCGGCKL